MVGILLLLIILSNAGYSEDLFLHKKPKCFIERFADLQVGGSTRIQNDITLRKCQKRCLRTQKLGGDKFKCSAVVYYEPEKTCLMYEFAKEMPGTLNEEAGILHLRTVEECSASSAKFHEPKALQPNGANGAAAAFIETLQRRNEELQKEVDELQLRLLTERSKVVEIYRLTNSLLGNEVVDPADVPPTEDTPTEGPSEIEPEFNLLGDIRTEYQDTTESIG